jgi:GntR family transcriptional regulator, transcriptional repressor for pyruvate dehydrogenase complex
MADSSRHASPGEPGSRLGAPVERHHASDQVFREIASAILRRDLPPGQPLPPERELAERFGVSRIVVREAIHRLKEYELVRVRQGSPTLVLDPDDATDIRLLSLEIDLMPEDDEAGAEAFTDRQQYGGAALLALAELHMTDAEIDALGRRIAAQRAASSTAGYDVAFERDVWVAIARGSRNRIFLRETLWYFNLLAREERFRRAMDSGVDRIALYESIAQMLRKREGAVAAYVRALHAVSARVTVAD